MKTTYYLVLVAVVAAAGVTVYARLPGGEKQAPSVPLSADARDVRRLELPPVALPPDDTPGDPMLIAPRGANLPLPLPVPAPSAPDLPPVTPTAGALPPLPLPSVPAMPEAPKPVAPPALPVPPALPKAALPVPPVPAVPPAPKPDALPLPPLPTMPSAPVAMPDLPAVPPMTAVPPALPPVAKPELPVPVPPAPKPEVALPPAVPPVPVQPPAPKPELNLLPPVTPAPLPPAPKPEAPLVPLVPPGTVVPPMPVQPPAPKPDAPLSPVVQPALQPLPRPQPVVQPEVPASVQPLPRPQPLPPVTTPAPSAPTASLNPKPQPLPPRVEPQPVLGPPPGTKFVLLKGDRLIECSSAAPNGDVWVVRQGALDRALPKGEVQFVGDSRDAIYKFVLARVKPADAGARLQVARWCMYVGMREQALAEAREVQKLDPKNGTAADMIRSLELSLKQFPPVDAPKMSAPPQPVYPVDLRPAVPPMATPVVPVVPQPAAPPIPPALEPDLDVPAAAARAFPGLALAVLQQKCAECHARGDYTGSFKLARVDLERPSERAVRDNLRAAVAQLSADGEHPLLEKARTAHGEMPRPALSHLDASYKSLSAWVASARGAGAKPVPPAAPTAPVGVPQLLPPAVPVSKPVGDPLLPPVPPPGAFGAALPPKPPVAPGTGDEFDPAGYNRELPK